MKMNITASPESCLNFLFFVIGMVGVWHVTHSKIALLWTIVASAHFTFKTQK